MGKISQFRVELNQTVFYSGQSIHGQVILQLNEGLKMRGIHLELFGGAYVHWTETRMHTHMNSDGSTRQRTETVHYTSRENYFENKVILYGNAGGVFSDSTVHPAGVYTYPFQFQLPTSLPSSFEGTHGNVRYYARCVIDRPWKFDHKTKKPFTVISSVDLNQIHDARSSPQGQDSKTLCCWCCASGPIEAVVRLDRKGYVPGENILINAEITNDSNRQVDSSKAQLVQITKFHAQGKTRTQKSLVAALSSGVLPEGESESWNAEPLHIPPLPPSQLGRCRIIDVQYYVKFVVDPSGPSFDLEIPLAITIGTIPLQNYFNDYSAAAAQAGYTMPGYTGAAGTMDPAHPTALPAYLDPNAPLKPNGTSTEWRQPQAMVSPTAPPGAPPPSYQESVFGRVECRDEGDTEHTMGEMSYAPIYPYYNWNQAAYSLPQQPPQKKL